MTATPVAVLDEDAISRIVGAEVERRLAPLVAEIAELRRNAGVAPASPVVLIAELAQIFGVDDRTIRRLVASHQVPPPTRMSERLVWWPREVIDRWIKSGGLPVARRGQRWQGGSAKKALDRARGAGSCHPHGGSHQ